MLVSGCGKAEGSSGPPVFGGLGASVATPAELPLPPENEGAQTEAGPCAAGSPPSDATLLDDFEDGDGKLFKAFHREGWWYTASDKTEGSTALPEGNFVAERLPEAEATRDNLYAAHLRAEGQRDWGVSWGTTLRWVNEGIRCALNASRFAGVKFRAKGPATVRVRLGTPATLPKEGGGVCEKQCYDSHGKLFTFTAEWQEYVVPFDRVQQGGWGTEARFDPSRLLDLSFSVEPKHLPADFWIDEIQFFTAEPAAQREVSARDAPTPPAGP